MKQVNLHYTVLPAYRVVRDLIFYKHHQSSRPLAVQNNVRSQVASLTEDTTKNLYLHVIEDADREIT